jgi:hypothetical protein
MAAAAAAIAAATFRTLLQPAASGVPVPPLPSVRFQGLQRHHVGLCLFASRRPVLLPPSAAAAGEAFSSGGEEFDGEEEEEEEYFDEGESEPEEQVEVPRAYSAPRGRPPRGEEAGRLFVGNLPYTFTSEELKDAFSEAGRVDDAQVPKLTLMELLLSISEEHRG